MPTRPEPAAERSTRSATPPPGRRRRRAKPPCAPASQTTAYLLARDVLRRIRRTSSLLWPVDGSGDSGGSGGRASRPANPPADRPAT